MSREDNILFGNISTIHHEVRSSFYYLFSVYSFLNGKIPDQAKISLDKIGVICKELRKDIDSLYINFNDNSAVTAAEQIRINAIKWEHELTHLFDLVNEIKHLNIQMEDPLLNKFLKQSLFYSLKNFSEIVDFLVTIQSKDLKQPIGKK